MHTAQVKLNPMVYRAKKHFHFLATQNAKSLWASEVSTLALLSLKAGVPAELPLFET